MTEQEYRHLYEVVDGEVDMAISCFYTELVLNQSALESAEVYAVLNKHGEFWRVHRYCLQSTFFITLGRVFDVNGDVRSMHTFLSAAIQHPELFAKDALRARKIALVRDTPDWLDDRINEAWEPTAADLRQLKKALAPYTASFHALYAPIRHQVFGHSVVTDQQVVQELFAKLQIPEIEQLLYFLRDLLSCFNDLLLNGTKPELGKRTYSYKDRVGKEVRQFLTAFGLSLGATTAGTSEL